MVGYLYKMLQHLSRHYMAGTEETSAAFMDYKELPLVPTTHEILNPNGMETQVDFRTNHTCFYQ